MPNMKNAKKAVRSSAKKEVSNNEYLASMKTAVKDVRRAVADKDKDKACSCLKTAIKRIDKATAKGAITKNKCARNKSNLTKKVNEM